MNRPRHILPAIVFSQFAGTSLWFAGNAVVFDLEKDWGLPGDSVASITSAVQSGFILGTLLFAVFAISDRFSPRLVFFWCSIIAAASNALLLFIPENLAWLLLTRFTTGFFLAGIYPVGMKIAAGWYEKGLGRALGYLVGALVLGTALPHLVRGTGTQLPWQQVIVVVSVLTLSGAVLMLIRVPDGPGLASGSRFNPKAMAIIFRSRDFRASAFGYFGHMWELYAFWAYLPAWFLAYSSNTELQLNVSLWTFLIIAIGFIGCVAGGIVSVKTGSAGVAALQLSVSGVCCMASPFLLQTHPALFFPVMLLWGITVIGDSPQFSALNAANAPREYVGSALTIVNSIGFLVTVVSIQFLSAMLPVTGTQFMFLLLLPGPLLGLIALKPLLRRTGVRA